MKLKVPEKITASSSSAMSCTACEAHQECRVWPQATRSGSEVTSRLSTDCRLSRGCSAWHPIAAHFSGRTEQPLCSRFLLTRSLICVRMEQIVVCTLA